MGTHNIDWNNGPFATITLTDTTNTITFTDRTDGEDVVLDARLLHIRIIQGSGLLPKTITSWPENVVFPAGSLPGLSLFAGQVDVVQLLEVQITPEENDYMYYGLDLKSNFL